MDDYHFICLKPTYRLRPLDLEVLQQLHNVVNVIPVIAKADTLTLDVIPGNLSWLSSLSNFILYFLKEKERQEFKKNIQLDLAQHRIGVYPFAKYDHPDDYAVNESYRVCN